MVCTFVNSSTTKVSVLKRLYRGRVVKRLLTLEKLPWIANNEKYGKAVFSTNVNCDGEDPSLVYSNKEGNYGAFSARYQKLYSGYRKGNNLDHGALSHYNGTNNKSFKDHRDNRAETNHRYFERKGDEADWRENKARLKENTKNCTYDRQSSDSHCMEQFMVPIYNIIDTTLIRVMIQLNTRLLSQSKYLSFVMDHGDTIHNIKMKISEQLNILPDQQVLSFKGVELDDIRTLFDYGIQEYDELILSAET